MISYAGAYCAIDLSSRDSQFKGSQDRSKSAWSVTP